MNKFIRILIALALCLSTVFALASCELLPEELRETIDGLLGNTNEEPDDEEELPDGGDEEEEEDVCKHVPGEWFVDKVASCKQEGYQKRYCVLCWEMIDEESVPKLDYHLYVDGVCKTCKEVQTESVGLTYGKDANGDTVVTGIGTCTDTSLYISATAPDGTAVVGIKSGAFKNATAIASLIVEEGVKYIESDAFNGASALDKVKLPESIEQIGDNAFRLCPIRIATAPAAHCGAVKNDSLRNLTVNGTGAIPERAFIGCAKLSMLTIEDGVTAIGKNAFSTTALTNVSIPGSVTRIGQSAFEFCKELKVLTIANGVKIIEDYAFQNSSFLDSVYIPASVEQIGYGAFYRCPRIATFTFEDPSGWVSTAYADQASGTAIPESSFSDAKLAAEYIKSHEKIYLRKDS